MAGSTFLTLTNKVLRSFNEVELTSSNFSTAIGVHAHARDSVNMAIQDIYQSEVEWPFTYTEGSITCVAGTFEYTLAATALRPDWESFRLQDDQPSSSYNASYLPYMTYERFLVFGHKDRLENASSDTYSAPQWVSNLPDNSVVVGPYPPDVAYKIDYDYYAAAVDLSAHGDTTTIPTQWDRVIVEGAKAYMYRFRDNIELAGFTDKKFQDGIKNMRTVLMNKYQAVYDTRTNMRLRSMW